MDESIILFEEERAALMKLLGAMGTKIFEARDANGDTALHRVARGIYSDKVADLIAGGADVNATNQQGRTPLHAAVEKLGIWEGPLVEILRAKPNVNAPDNEGMTPLHVLAVSPSIFSAQATRALLNAGANPNIQDRRGRTAAHLALSGEWPWNQAGECLGMLVEAGADLSLRDDHGRTPLHYLAGLGDKQPLFFIRGITNIFGSTNVDIAARDNQGDTPLHIAARTGTSDVFDWLVQRGASLDVTNNAGETPRGLAARSLSRFPRGRPSAETDIFRAVSEGKLETVATLLKADSGLLELTNRFGHTPLRAAVLAGQTNIVEFLEARGARWDAVSAAWAGRADVLQQILASDRAAITNTLGGSSLLYIAADRGNLEVARLLLAAGSDPNGRERSGLSPLGAARARNQKEIANLLIAHGAVLNIFDATRLDDLEAATELIRTNRWLVNATNPAGIAVAEMAAEGGRDRILKLLLDKGVSVNFANPRNGRTLLHTAVTHNQTNTAALLLRRGAKVDAFDRNGVTPLHMASALGYADMAALLLKHRANPNARSLPVSADAELPFVRLFTLPVNCTALHMAALYAQTNVIELLIRAGADVNATNAAGMTPLDFVKQRMILSMRPPGFVSFGPEQPVVPPGMVGRAGQDFYTSFESRRKMAANLLEAAGGKSGRPTAPAGYRHP